MMRLTPVSFEISNEGHEKRVNRVLIKMRMKFHTYLVIYPF